MYQNRKLEKKTIKASCIRRCKKTVLFAAHCLRYVYKLNRDRIKRKVSLYCYRDYISGPIPLNRFTILGTTVMKYLRENLYHHGLEGIYSYGQRFEQCMQTKTTVTYKINRSKQIEPLPFFNSAL